MICCKVCGSKNYEDIYTPINSKIGLKIKLCKDCGMVFSSIDGDPDQFNHDGNFVGLSCDADYSAIRVGKAQMVQTALNLFEKERLKNSRIKRILDMSSARGHFIRAAAKYFGSIKLDCIEPDAYMTNSYIKDKRFYVTNKKYKNYEPLESYDLIYSCHTLEHFRNPRENLEWINANLNIDGYLYLEVPNLECIQNQFNVDEYFYDMHLSYFDQVTLSNFLTMLSFEIISQKVSQGSIAFLCRKSGNKSRKFENQYVRNKKLIETYKINITRNREELVSRKNDIQRYISKENSVIFGCGKMLDFLIRYCQIDFSDCLFVDNFLSEATESIFGKKLLKLKNIPDINSSRQFLILAQSSVMTIKGEIEARFPDSKIKSIGDFISHA